MLFDHGVDALSVGMQALIVIKFIQVGSSNTLAILGVIGVTSTFYYTMIEEYYTGGLFLGPFNGVSDGSVVLYTFFIIGAFLGNETFN